MSPRVVHNHERRGLEATAFMRSGIRSEVVTEAVVGGLLHTRVHRVVALDVTGDDAEGHGRDGTAQGDLAGQRTLHDALLLAGASKIRLAISDHA
jgi:hypothetical protein